MVQKTDTVIILDTVRQRCAHEVLMKLAVAPESNALTAPLTAMTHEKFDWKQGTWDKDYSLFFVTLKEAIANSLSLFFPDYTLPWVLRTDASEAGVGAVLLQVATDESGNEVYQPLGFTSQKFSDPATRWTTIEQEAYGKIRASCGEHALYHFNFVPGSCDACLECLVFISRLDASAVSQWLWESPGGVVVERILKLKRGFYLGCLCEGLGGFVESHHQAAGDGVGPKFRFESSHSYCVGRSAVEAGE